MVRLGLLAGANVLMSFALQWLIVVMLGPGPATDALFAAEAAPLLFAAVATGSLSHVLVPLLSGENDEQSRRDAWTFFVLLGLLGVVVSAILSLFASYWVPALVPGFSDTQKILTTTLTRIQLVGVVFTVVTGVLWSVCRARRQFAWPEVANLSGSVLAIAIVVWMLPRFGVAAAAWAWVLQSIVPAALLLPSLGGFRRPRLGSWGVTEAWRRIRPLLLGMTYYKTDPVVDRFLSSLAPAGGLTLLNLAQQAWGALAQVLNRAITGPLVPALATYAKEESWSMFRQAYRTRLVLITAISAVCFVALLAVGPAVLALLVGHGGVTATNVRLLWWLMVALGGVLVGGAAGQIVSSAFYSMGNTTTPTRIGMAGFTVGIALKTGGFLWLGVVGIALGASTYYLLNVCVLFVLLERRLRNAAYQ
ncbi:MAG: lipid II flippase MurJ [Gemmatimonadales bacterium]